MHAGTPGVIKHESERLGGAPGAAASAMALQPARISQGATSSGAQETLRPQTCGRAHGRALKMMDAVGIHGVSSILAQNTIIHALLRFV